MSRESVTAVTVDGRCRSRVIMYTPEPAGGMAYYVSELVVALAQAGVRVVLLAPANFQHNAKVCAAGAELVHAPCRKTSKAGLSERLLRNVRFAAQTARVLFRLVRRGDIVHLQDTFNLPLGLVFFLLPILRGGSVVFTAHDPLPHRWHFPRGFLWLERRILQLSCQLSDGIIVHNNSGKDVLVRKLSQPANRIFVIPHGAYSNAADGNQPYPRFDCLRLLAFGAIRENKGLHLAIRAVQIAASVSPVPIRLTIAGGLANAAEEPYWRACKQLISARPEGIEVIERHIADEEIGPLLARHHAVLLPYTEFFAESGVANLALSHQRPIIASTAGGLGNLIDQGQCGIPIAAPSAEAVACAIAKAVQAGPERLHKMGIAGGEFIRKTRSWNSIARQTAQVYSQLGKLHVQGGTPQAVFLTADKNPQGLKS